MDYPQCGNEQAHHDLLNEGYDSPGNRFLPIPTGAELSSGGGHINARQRRLSTCGTEQSNTESVFHYETAQGYQAIQNESFLRSSHSTCSVMNVDKTSAHVTGEALTATGVIPAVDFVQAT